MKEIQTNGKTIVLVEVPEDVKDFRLDKGYIWFKSNTFDKCCIYEPHSRPHEILGKSTELSEEQMKGICERGIIGFVDYKMKGFSNFESAKQSYLSLLEANGIVDRNAIKKPEYIDVDGKLGCFDIPSQTYRYDKMIAEWQEAQSKVKHYLVLEKI